jgi:pimeloyl-ACP methyl ester carboxylesterase
MHLMHDDRNCAVSRSESRELVFLLHGFGGRPVLMSRLAKFLCRNNFAVCNWAYPSVREPLARNTNRLEHELARIDAAGEFLRVHFVTHSLGGIVVRQLLSESPGSLVHRIVMLAPPNSGSHMARFGSLILRGFCPVLREISDRTTSLVQGLSAPCDCEIGIIAGSGDWVVRQNSTHLPTERDHIVVRAGHLRLPLVRSCLEQTTHFLKHGTFQRHETPRNPLCANLQAR